MAIHRISSIMAFHVSNARKPQNAKVSRYFNITILAKVRIDDYIAATQYQNNKPTLIIIPGADLFHVNTPNDIAYKRTNP